MFFTRLKTPGLGQNSYVLGCGDGLAVIVDPRRDVDELRQRVGVQLQESQLPDRIRVWEAMELYASQRERRAELVR